MHTVQLCIQYSCAYSTVVHTVQLCNSTCTVVHTNFFVQLCIQYSCARVVCEFINYMMIRIFSSGVRFGFFIDKHTSEEVKFLILEMLSFNEVYSNLDHITQIYILKSVQYYLPCTDVIFFLDHPNVHATK